MELIIRHINTSMTVHDVVNGIKRAIRVQDAKCTSFTTATLF